MCIRDSRFEDPPARGIGERHGREQRYRITPGPLTGAMAWMAEVGAAWDERLARLRTRLER